MVDKKKVVLIILGVISVFVWLRGLVFFGNNRRAKNYPGGALSSPLASARQASRSQYKDYKRNPFAPASVSQSQNPGLQLGGIMYDGKESYCLINDQIVRIGDVVGAYRLTAIANNKATLSDGTKEIELKLEE